MGLAVILSLARFDGFGSGAAAHFFSEKKAAVHVATRKMSATSDRHQPWPTIDEYW